MIYSLVPTGSRATATYRFGFVALDILNVINADAGVYTCRATNVMGQAETSANLRITGKISVLTDVKKLPHWLLKCLMIHFGDNFLPLLSKILLDFVCTVWYSIAILQSSCLVNRLHWNF